MKKLFLIFFSLLSIASSIPANNTASHVIIIGIDGWGSYSVPVADSIPHIRQAMRLGSYTLSKRAVLPSVSGPNWAAMFNGTPAEFSGIIGNEYEPSFRPSFQNEHHAQSTVFHLLRQQQPDAEQGIVCEWDGVQHYVDTLCLSHNEVIANPVGHPESIVDASIRYIRNAKPTLCFIHIDALDHAGHQFGEGSSEYYATLTHIDYQIGLIVDGIREAGIYDNSVIIITSDHGHKGKNHGGHALSEIDTPFIIWGKGVKVNHRIHSLMIQYDVAATIARIFNLPTPPSWRGIAVDVFE